MVSWKDVSTVLDEDVSGRCRFRSSCFRCRRRPVFNGWSGGVNPGARISRMRRECSREALRQESSDNLWRAPASLSISPAVIFNAEEDSRRNRGFRSIDNRRRIFKNKATLGPNYTPSVDLSWSFRCLCISFQCQQRNQLNIGFQKENRSRLLCCFNDEFKFLVRTTCETKK
jgi:hypothetical protein